MKDILNSFEVWSDAQGIKSRLRIKSIENISLEGIARLRELILELAIRGKLIKQDSNDTPVEKLLNEIEAKKIELIKSGKLRKEKPQPFFSNNQHPYLLPQGWIFKQFGEITFNRDAERIPISEEERLGRKGNFDYYGASGVIDKIDSFIFDKPLLLIGEDGANLINRSTPIAFIARGKYWVNNHAHVIDGISYEFLHYLELYINAISLLPYITGTAQPKMNQAKMNSILVGIPPIEEQKRIVAKVNELMALCDDLEKQKTNHLKTHQQLVKCLLETLSSSANADELQSAWQRLAPHFDELFCTEDSIEQLKQTILQLAVMGKLVKQDERDELASVLIEKIRKERHKLLRDGAIKKINELTEVVKSEKSFLLPEKWTYCRLGDVIINIVGGGTPSKNNPEYWNGNIPWASVKDLKGKYISDTEDKITDKAIAASATHIIPKGNIIVCTRMGLGKIAINEVDVAINQDLKGIFLPKHINKDYFFLLYSSLKIVGKGTTVDGIRQDQLLAYEILLPPLAEQKRIVAKVEELFSLCHALKSKLQKAQEIQNTLAETVVAGVNAGEGEKKVKPGKVIKRRVVGVTVED